MDAVRGGRIAIANAMPPGQAAPPHEHAARHPNNISGNAERGSISPGECKVTSELRLWAIRFLFFL